MTTMALAWSLASLPAWWYTGSKLAGTSLMTKGLAMSTRTQDAPSRWAKGLIVFATTVSPEATITYGGAVKMWGGGVPRNAGRILDKAVRIWADEYGLDTDTCYGLASFVVRQDTKQPSSGLDRSLEEIPALRRNAIATVRSKKLDIKGPC